MHISYSKNNFGSVPKKLSTLEYVLRRWANKGIFRINSSQQSKIHRMTECMDSYGALPETHKRLSIRALSIHFPVGIFELFCT